MKRICNWCARVSDGTPSEPWPRATLLIEGLDDGSISWLPKKTLDFCDRKECVEQVLRVESFLEQMPEASEGIRIRLSITDETDGLWSHVDRRIGHYDDAAEDARALARFFHETSHPKLRRVLEAFEDGGQGTEAKGRPEAKGEPLP